MARAAQSVSRHVFYITSATAAKVPLPKGVHPHRGNRLQNVTARAERFIYMSGTWARTAPPPHPHPCGRPLAPCPCHHPIIIRRAMPSQPTEATKAGNRHGNGDEEQHTPTNQDEEPTTHTKTAKTTYHRQRPSLNHGL